MKETIFKFLSVELLHIVKVFVCIVEILNCIINFILEVFALPIRLIISIPHINFMLGCRELKKINGKLTEEEKKLLVKILLNSNSFKKLSLKKQNKLSEMVYKLNIKEN